MKVDKLDLKILKLLSKNCKRSFRSIAKELGVSTATVISRIERMRKEGIIKGYTVLLDHEKLGYQLTVAIEITISKGKLIEVEKKIAKFPNVLCVYDITGLTDTLVIAKFKTRKELNDFVKMLLAMPYVERTNTHLVLNTIKEDFRLI